jgi:hypothetical protein
MHCSHCRSLMVEAEVSRGPQSQQTWYECPSCGRVHLLSCCVTHDPSEIPLHPLTTPWHTWAEQRRQHRSLGQLPRLGARMRGEIHGRSVA